MKNSSFWRIATAVFAVGSIIYTTVSSAQSRKESRDRHESDHSGSEYEYDVPTEYEEVFEKNQIVPAGWAFGAVWSTIYSGLAALLVHQALPSEEHNPRYEKAQPWWWASWALNAIFGRFFSQNDPQSIIISDLTTKINLPVAIGLHQSLEIGKTDVPAPEKYLRIPVSLYAGWLTAATVVGTPNTLLTLGAWTPQEEDDEPISAGILAATAGAGYFIARRLNDPWYMLPFVAGFSGIATRQWHKEPILGWTAATLAAVYSGLLAYWLPRGKFHEYDRYVVNDVEAAVLAGPFETDQPYQAEIARERMKPIEAEGLD
ncbi:TspO/MBR family protein [Spirosoma sp.]|uniref:TspO/MBR family protein n=1 Tax=Spirosoma sp. TaxID=1899569 RepID=UPI003B3A89AE